MANPSHLGFFLTFFPARGISQENWYQSAVLMLAPNTNRKGQGCSKVAG